MSNTDKATTVVGVDYLTTIERENAIMQMQISILRRVLKREIEAAGKTNTFVSSKDIITIFGFIMDEPNEYQE